MGDTMRAAKLVAPGRFEVVEAPVPEPADGEVLVAMTRASICGSDLHAILGPHPRPVEAMAPGSPGHEGVGTVVASRSTRVPPGGRVLTVPMPGVGGCFAEYQAVGDAFVVPLPDGDLERLLLAQQLGTTVFGFHRYWPDGRDAAGATAAVLGAGSAGCFLLQLARRAGFSRLVACDLDERRLSVASALGADVVVHAPEESFVEAVLEATGGAGAELVIEASGRDESRAACIDAAATGGRVGFFGLPEHPGLAPFPLSTAFRRACTVEMAGNAQLEPGLAAFREAVGLIASGAIDVAAMLEPSFPLERFAEAFAAARDHVGLKVAVEIASGP